MGFAPEHREHLAHEVGESVIGSITEALPFFTPRPSTWNVRTVVGSKSCMAPASSRIELIVS